MNEPAFAFSLTGVELAVIKTLGLFLLSSGVVFLLLLAPGQDNKTPRRPVQDWLKAHYVALLLSFVGLLAVIALSVYIVEIGFIVGRLVDRLRISTNDPATDPDALRGLAYAVAALLGVLGAAATIAFSSIRVWINERTAKATEEGLITDRINKAVEALGAEKTVSRIGADVTFAEPKPDGQDGETLRRALHYEDAAPPERREGESLREVGSWKVLSRTVPNLEVRIGAIYALERIAQDSPRDHIQVMEILCAYIRQNAPAIGAVPFPAAWWEAFNSDDDALVAKRPDFGDIQRWGQGLPKPCTDIQVALEVIGRRSTKQIAVERAADVRGSNVGYVLDLREANLQRADLTELNFENALFTGAQLQGAVLVGAQLQGAVLAEAQLQGANLREAQMQGAVLAGAQLQGADLVGAQLQRAVLAEAQLQRANLWAAHMDAATDLNAAALRGAALRSVDDATIAQLRPFFDDLFADGTVLPDDPDRPEHWATEDLGWEDFNTAWRAWQRSIGMDPDNPQ